MTHLSSSCWWPSSEQKERNSLLSVLFYLIKIVPFVCNLKGMSIHILDIQMVDFRRTLEVTEATVVIDFRLCETVSAKNVTAKFLLIEV